MKISIIIPTHNRCASLLRTLHPLCADPHLATSGEVIVVADGCRDSTATRLRAGTWPWPLRVLEQDPGRGAAAARNRGAAIAQGRVLLFLDDDIEPCPDLVERHLDAHRDAPRRAVVGAYPPALEGPAAPVHVLKRDWWLGRFHEMGQPGHRFSYRDLLSGNLSLPVALFRELGGFDDRIGSAGGEDYEFGIRLFAAGAELAYEPAAVALHHEHETTDLARYMRRARQEGLADVRIAERHPSIRYALPLWHRHRGGRTQRAARAAVWAGRFGAPFPLSLTPLLRTAELIGAQRHWLRLCGALHEYWYWRGVRDAVGDRDALERLLADSVPPEGRELELDLAGTLEAAEGEIDRVRPDGLRLRYGNFAMGRIAPAAATEPLRGRHLRRLLVTELAWPLLKAKAAHEALVQGRATDPMESGYGSTAAMARTG